MFTFPLFSWILIFFLQTLDIFSPYSWSFSLYSWSFSPYSWSFSSWYSVIISNLYSSDLFFSLNLYFFYLFLPRLNIFSYSTTRNHLFFFSWYFFLLLFFFLPTLDIFSLNSWFFSLNSWSFFSQLLIIFLQTLDLFLPTVLRLIMRSLLNYLNYLYKNLSAMQVIWRLVKHKK